MRSLWEDGKLRAFRRCPDNFGRAEVQRVGRSMLVDPMGVARKAVRAELPCLANRRADILPGAPAGAVRV